MRKLVYDLYAGGNYVTTTSNYTKRTEWINSHNREAKERLIEIEQFPETEKQKQARIKNAILINKKIKEKRDAAAG